MSKTEKALNTAISAIYFADSSDYKKALFSIIEQLGGEKLMNECCGDISSVYKRVERQEGLNND